MDSQPYLGASSRHFVGGKEGGLQNLKGTVGESIYDLDLAPNFLVRAELLTTTTLDNGLHLLQWCKQRLNFLSEWV